MAPADLGRRSRIGPSMVQINGGRLAYTQSCIQLQDTSQSEPRYGEELAWVTEKEAQQARHAHACF
jgi:hypothetical protein